MIEGRWRSDEDRVREDGRYGVPETVDVVHIGRHDYESHGSINPTRIVPVGPWLEFV